MPARSGIISTWVTPVAPRAPSKPFDTIDLVGGGINRGPAGQSPDIVPGRRIGHDANHGGASDICLTMAPLFGFRSNPF